MDNTVSVSPQIETISLSVVVAPLTKSEPILQSCPRVGVKVISANVPGLQFANIFKFEFTISSQAKFKFFIFASSGSVVFIEFMPSSSKFLSSLGSIFFEIESLLELGKKTEFCELDFAALRHTSKMLLKNLTKLKKVSTSELYELDLTAPTDEWQERPHWEL